MASYRSEHLEDDIISMATLSDDEDNGIPILLTSCDASTFTHQSIDPPAGDDAEFQRKEAFMNSPYFSNRERYHRNGAETHPTQEFNRRYTNPDYHHGRKPDPEPYTTADNSDEDDDPLIQLARRMSNTCGIEDTASIEGPNDEEYWRSRKSNRKHKDGNFDDSINSGKEFRTQQRSRGMGSYHERSEDEKNPVRNISKESKMKGNVRSSPRRADSKHVDNTPDEGNTPRRHLGPRDRASSRSMSRGSKSCRSSNGSISSKDSRHSSRSGSSSRRRKHEPKLTVEEAVAFLNGRQQMARSPSLSSVKSYSSVSRKSKRSACEPKVKKNTVMKVVSAANELKGKLRRRIVSDKTRNHDTTFISSDEESSWFGS